ARISKLHFKVTASNDLQVFADSELLNYILPTATVSFTAPNQWVDYIKMSSGKGTSYPITTVNGTYSSGSVKADVKITFTGVYTGIEKTTVARGTYDSA